jgi:hypothetical protein
MDPDKVQLLEQLAAETRIPKSVLMREAIDMLLNKYGKLKPSQRKTWKRRPQRVQVAADAWPQPNDGGLIMATPKTIRNSHSFRIGEIVTLVYSRSGLVPPGAEIEIAEPLRRRRVKGKIERSYGVAFAGYPRPLYVIPDQIKKRDRPDDLLTLVPWSACLWQPRLVEDLASGFRSAQ